MKTKIRTRQGVVMAGEGRLTDYHKLTIDINRGWLKDDHIRSSAIEHKISWILLAHAPIFLLINGFFNVSSDWDQLGCVICFLIYGVSFLFSVFALSPVTMYFDKWDEEKSISENNKLLCKNVDDTRTNVNIQCSRFKRAQCAFFVTTIIMVVIMSIVMYDNMKGDVIWKIKTSQDQGLMTQGHQKNP